MIDSSKMKNEFLQTYLQYVEHTESPIIMHLWCAVSCAGAAMGRHVWTPFGHKQKFGNMYVLLVGPPATKKSTAIEIATDLLQLKTKVKLAPDDTAGKKQGLISTMATKIASLAIDDSLLDNANALSLEDMLETEFYMTPTVDKHTIFIVAEEFGSFIGQNNLDLTRFLIKLWDGRDYNYQLKAQQLCLTNTLGSMLGGTTPTEIACLLPPEAMGQGFMSRKILVFASKKAKFVPTDEFRLDNKLEPELAATYKWINETMRGEIKESPRAKRANREIECHTPAIRDTRFLFYIERRHTHLRKLESALAALRRSYLIELEDVETALSLLEETEAHMPEALGEYGLSPLAVAKQKMIEFLQHIEQPVSEKILWSFMMRDMKPIDFQNSVSDLHNSGKIKKVQTTAGLAYVAKDSHRERVLDLLAEKEEEKTETENEADIIQLGIAK